MTKATMFAAGVWFICLAFCPQFIAADEQMKLQPSNLIDFPYLTDPNTLAASIKWDGTLKDYGRYLIESRKKQRRMNVRYTLDGLFPFVHHPDGIFRADVDGALNWVFEAGGVAAAFTTGDGSETIIAQGKPYFGSLAINGSCEATSDSATEKWMMRNYLVGLKLRQMIPGSDIDLIGKVLGLADDKRLSGNIPIVAELSVNRVYETDPGDTSFYRIDVVVDWGFQLIEQACVYSHFELTQVDDVEAQTYFTAELAKYFRLGEQSASVLGLDTEFVFLVRYVTGKRPPDYIQIDDWEIGVGLDWSGAL